MHIARVTLIVAAPLLAQQAAPPPAALVREGVTEQLTARVWAIPDGSAPLVPNVGIIVGAKGVLVVDTGMGARNAQTVLKEVAKVGAGKPLFIVTTHVHPEHDLGAHAFPAGSTMIRSADQTRDIAESGMRLAHVFASRSTLNAELLEGATYRAADITFEKMYSLDLGGVTATITAMGANHTVGDTVVLAEGVLFSGDVAMRAQPSFTTPRGTVSHWLASLAMLAAMKPTHVVPSHGARGDASIIEGYRVYLTRVQQRVTALKKTGRTEDQVVEAVTGELAGEYPDRARLCGAIRAAYAEAQ